MSKNIIQNKTEFIQFRLDRDSKITAKALADKYFDGKMSAMFRYMLNNTDLTKIYNTTEANGFDRSCKATFAGGSSTQEVVDSGLSMKSTRQRIGNCPPLGTISIRSPIMSMPTP